MPLYSRKDFAELCYTTKSDLFNYIRRKKVITVEGNDDLIDSANATNAAFMVQRQTLQTKKVIIAKVHPKVDASVEGKKNPAQTVFEYPPEMKSTVMENFQTEATLKKSTLEKTTNEIKLQNLKIQKLQGDVIPTQLVKNLVAQYSKSITVSYRDGAEIFLIDIAKQAGLNGEQIADLRGKLIKIINSSVDAAIKQTAEGLKNIVTEYTNSRGVGESE